MYIVFYITVYDVYLVKELNEHPTATSEDNVHAYFALEDNIKGKEKFNSHFIQILKVIWFNYYKLL
jgi:hypothetical protein